MSDCLGAVHAGPRLGPASSRQQAGYELQIMPPSGGDWPVLTDRPDTGLGGEREASRRRGLQSEISCNTIIHQAGETGETGETGGRTNTKEL